MGRKKGNYNPAREISSVQKPCRHRKDFFPIKDIKAGSLLQIHIRFLSSGLYPFHPNLVLLHYYLWESIPHLQSEIYLWQCGVVPAQTAPVPSLGVSPVPLPSPLFVPSVFSTSQSQTGLVKVVLHHIIPLSSSSCVFYSHHHHSSSRWLAHYFQREYLAGLWGWHKKGGEKDSRYSVYLSGYSVLDFIKRQI